MLSIAICKMFVRRTKLPPSQIDFLKVTNAPAGKFMPIGSQQKQKINSQIDIKMQELQDTGLSREQILLSKSHKGIPLASDPFFQFLKNNKLAREIYLKKSDRFTVEKVIDIALRQDIGVDPSYSAPITKNRFDPAGTSEFFTDMKEKSEHSFDPERYYSNKSTTVQKLYDELKPHQTLKFFFKPIDKYQRVHARQKVLKKYDIHWRNIELLRQFISDYGNIKSRFTNSVSAANQKRIMKAVKTARHNNAIPYSGKILPPNKRNIVNLEDQVKQVGMQNVSLDFGHVYTTRPLSLDSIEAGKSHERDLDVKFQYLKKKERSFQLWLDKRDPNEDEEFINAEKYARNIKSKQIVEKKQPPEIQKYRVALKDITALDEDFQPMKFEGSDSEECKDSFEKRKAHVKKQLEVNPFKISDILMEEKTI